jgi:uncharacterized membrane protein
MTGKDISKTQDNQNVLNIAFTNFTVYLAHFLYVTFILGNFVMDALFSDFSWQTSYRGICNITVLVSDICTYTVYEAIFENWHGMYCNDIRAHMHKTALIEEPTCTFRQDME